MCITESWLSDEILDSEILPSTYSVFRQDRKFNIVERTRGGGVLLAINSSYAAVQIDLSVINETIPLIDIVGCYFLLDFKKILVFVLYIPPDITSDELDHFLNMFEEATAYFNNHVIILGDFNITYFNDHSSRDRKCQIIDAFLNFTDFHQINTVANNRGRLLDLVITNFAQLSLEREELPLVQEDLDHPAIKLCLKHIEKPSPCLRSNTNAHNYNYRKADFISLYNSLSSADWSDLYKSKNINEACAILYNVTYCHINSHVPLRTNRYTTYPVWFTPQHINDIKQKNYFRKRYIRNKSLQDLSSFKMLRNKIKTNSKALYLNYLQRVQSSIQGNPREFWKFIHSKNKDQSIPNTLKSTDGTLLNTPHSIVNGFATFFESVYLPTSNTSLSSPQQYNGNLPIDIFSFTEEDILLSLRSLKDNLVMGNDNIPSFILKDCAQVFVGPLHHIFTLSVQSSTFPDVWKIARLVPVPKKGDRHSIDNYRPIAIINNFAKVFERCLYNRIYPLVHPLLSTSQHGFVNKRSTTTNLVEFTQFLANNIDNNKQVDVVYTDFSKAFDTVDHSLLLRKLDRLGFSLPLVSLFSSYLFKRKHYVRYMSHESNHFYPSSGVPQGSNLGPLLFSIFIDDLCDMLSCHKLLFADDLKIYAIVENVVDCQLVQHQIDTVHGWCVENNLSMNVSKCKVITFTRKIKPIIHDYHYDGNLLERSTSTKDLGVIFDSRLSFVEHINNICNNALKTLGFILRTCKKFHNTTCIMSLYYAYVRSRLEYASVVWSPMYRCHIYSLEQVQRRFLKYLYFKEHFTYPVQGYSHDSLLHTYNVTQLDLRRSQIDLKFLFNLLHNRIDSMSLLSEVNFTVPRLSARSSTTFYCSKSNTNILLNSPMYRMCATYNSLSDASVDINFMSLPVLMNKCKPIIHYH